MLSEQSDLQAEVDSGVQKLHGGVQGTISKWGTIPLFLPPLKQA